MRRSIRLLLVGIFLLVVFTGVAYVYWGASMIYGGASLSTKGLEAQQKLVQRELSELAVMSLDSGVAPIGYRSRPLESADTPYWVQIDFQYATEIEQIILVPTIWRNSDGAFLSDAFPKSFRIVANNSKNDEIVLAEFADTSDLLPRIAPLIIPLEKSVSVNSVRLEITEVSRRAINGDYIFQLAEIMLMNGERNVALHQKLTTSGASYPDKGWGTKFLVDGVLPYLMNAADGESSRPYVSEANFEGTPEITFDLGERRTLNGIRLYAVDQADTLPQTYAGNYGFPHHFKLEVANNPDFSDSQEMLDVFIDTDNDVGPIMQWYAPRFEGRYARLTVLSSYKQRVNAELMSRTGFSEIELLMMGQVIPNVVAQANFRHSDPSLTDLQLTDGLNFYGEILPIRQWLEELARRHDLNNTLVDVNSKLKGKYAAQRDRLQMLTGVTLVLLFLLISFYLIQRLERVKHESLIRERIASNLHDELGANLHAIGHWGELALECRNEPDDLAHILERIHSITHRTGNAARDCSHMLKNQDLCDDLPLEIRRMADRVLADLNYELMVEGESYVDQLSRRVRVDLLLFIKEGAINIIRHSHAKNVLIKLSAEPSLCGINVTLEIKDDGIGVEMISHSLKSRAKLLKGDLTNLAAEHSGCTHLQLKLSRLHLRLRKAPL